MGKLLSIVEVLITDTPSDLGTKRPVYPELETY
jgi:hypothetical protein